MHRKMLRADRTGTWAPVLSQTTLAAASPQLAAMPTITVHHHTVYRYAKPVQFGEHRLMFRPRDSHDLRLLDTALSIQPAAALRGD